MIPNQFKQIKDSKPSNYERILVFYRGQWEIFTYNAQCGCWDDSDGDDYRHDINPEDIWTELPIKALNR